jgi:hypothetical protein
VVAIDADRVGTGLRLRQREFLELRRLGVEAADLAASAFAEPDDAVGIHLQALRLALGGRVEFGQDAVARDSAERAILAERGKPLVAVLADHVAVGPAEIEMLELLGLGVEHRNRRTAADPHQSLLIHPDGVRAGAPAVGQGRILKFRDLLGGRVQLADLAQRRFREPDGTVGAGITE